MSKEVIEITSANFDELVNKENWVIDFWAEWCGPCKVMAPDFEKVAIELGAKINFGKVNVDNEMDLAQRFEVMSIPTTLLLKNGNEINRMVGAKKKEEILEEISQSF